MKRLLNLLLTLAVVTSAMAGTVNRQQAREAAAQFALKKGAQLGTEPFTVRGRRVQAADQPLYIFNTTDGFVIVAADECETPIVAYSHEGRFDATNIPVQMEEYLQDFVARIDKEIVFLQPISQ